MAANFTTTITTVRNLFKNIFKPSTPLQPITKQ